MLELYPSPVLNHVSLIMAALLACLMLPVWWHIGECLSLQWEGLVSMVLLVHMVSGSLLAPSPFLRGQREIEDDMDIGYTFEIRVQAYN